MAIRRAVSADGATILARATSVENPPYYGDGEAAVRGMAELAEREPIFIDDAGFIGWIMKDAAPARRLYTVLWLLPGEIPGGPPPMMQAEFDLRRARLLKTCLADAWTNATPDERLWRIEARFHRAKNAAGQRDGGLEAVMKWRGLLIALRPTGTRPQIVAPVVPPGNPPDTAAPYTIWWDLNSAHQRMQLFEPGLAA